MISKLLKLTLGKELILLSRHRNSEPLLNEVNKKEYFFLDPVYLLKATAIFGRRTKLRYKAIYAMLSILNPVYIIDINWLSKKKTVYLVWCNNHNRSFIVVQHGIYHGGTIRFIPEKYVKCNIFLVWGKHFKEMVEANNPGKSFQCITFGNPCYNIYDRSTFSYKAKTGNRILVALSVVKDERLEALYLLLGKLQKFGFDVRVKEHGMQSQKSVPLEGDFKKQEGNLYDILMNQEYDIVVTDVSSAMTDIIFFKNRALYFSPEQPGADLNDNVYSEYLRNLAHDIERVNTREQLLSYVDIDTQENLLKYLIKTENTSNDLRQIKDACNDNKSNLYANKSKRMAVKQK